MVHIISIPLRKGGSGKTTTATNLAAGLCLRGKKVLLVDTDDQANATMCVGINPFGLLASISTLFTDINVHIQDVIQTTDYGLSVLPADQSLEQVSAGMNATSIKELTLILKPIWHDYDYIIIDTQPGHSYLSISALVASDYALIPLQVHYLALEGLERIMGDIREVQHGNIDGSKRGHNAELQVFGIIPCMVQNTNISKAILDKAKQDYSDLILPMEIRLATKFINTSLEGSPMVIGYPSLPSALEYMALVDYVIAKLEQDHAEETE